VNLNMSEFLVALIQAKPFYGRIVASLQRVAKKDMGTMAVGVRDGRVILYYDPDFVRRLDIPTACFVLEHEMLHLLLDHIPRYLELLALQANKEERVKASHVYNVAMDCAINSLLRNHDGFAGADQVLIDTLKEKNPEAADDPNNGMCLPEKYGLPDLQAFETYQYLLMRNVKTVTLCVKHEGATPHDGWNDPNKGDSDGEGGDTLIVAGAGDMTSDELLSQAHRLREQIKDHLRKVARSMGGIGRGLLPAGVEEWLEAYLADPIIPWWEIFITRAKQSRASKYARSTAQPNRTLMALAEEDPKIIPMPGRVRDKSWRVFLMVDTSGSMSTESLEIVKSELQHMLSVDEGMEIRYMEGDAAVHRDILLRRGDEIPREVLGRGGTDFNAYLKHMQQYCSDDDKAPDIVICYTDGYCPPPDKSSRLPADIPFIWLVTPQHANEFGDYGEVIVCDNSVNNRYKG
jgi:predicted metal-dependent peptidase